MSNSNYKSRFHQPFVYLWLLNAYIGIREDPEEMPHNVAFLLSLHILFQYALAQVLHAENN